jgi:hypothetical protein
MTGPDGRENAFDRLVKSATYLAFALIGVVAA